MRVSAAISIILCVVALILSFLCLFAGSSKGFMEDYAIITLNTSRIGENVVQEVSQKLCDFGSNKKQRDLFASPTEDARSLITDAPTLTRRDRRGLFSSLTHKAASVVSSAEGAAKSEAASLCDELSDDLGDKLEEVLQRIGLNDWYSAHVMDFCQGYYIPGPVPNGTCDTCIAPGTIHKNVTACSNNTVNNHFDPKSTLAEQLKQNTNGEIDLTDVKWPHQISDGLNALKIAQKAVFVFYCIAITSIFLALLLAIFGMFHQGRLSALTNIAIDSLAFLTILIASAIVTVIAVKSAHLINKYGNDVGIRANRGNKFIALTWSATGVVGLSWVVWLYEFVASWKRDRAVKAPKYG